MTTPPGTPSHHLTVDERTEIGRAARVAVPRSNHRAWTPAAGRPDPVALIEAQNADRVPWLVPLRHARMRVSPFTFYRGSAGIMAADLAPTPTSGLSVQVGGDAHLSNFGAYASPSRQLVFDQNDFDETLPGPWEWDVKRLTASFVVAAQHLGFRTSVTRRVAAASVQSYRAEMRRFAGVGLLDVWYDYTTPENLPERIKVDKAELAKRLARFDRRAKSRTSLQAVAKLTEKVDGEYRIRSQQPVLFPIRDLPREYDADVLESAAIAAYERYKGSLADDRRVLLDRYVPREVGVKVVGVGSVGTRCFIILLEGRDREDVLFVQAKEAGPSVLEAHLGPSVYDNHGRRVVEGQRLSQAQSDIMLGWTQGGPLEKHYYLRQLRDWKGSVEIEESTPEQLEFYAKLCGMTLARAHARSGDPIAIATYLGKGDSFDRAVTEFGERYAEQNQLDYEQFQAAIRDGRLDADAPEDAV